MKQIGYFTIIGVFMTITGAIETNRASRHGQKGPQYTWIKTADDLTVLFPQTVSELENRVETALAQTKQAIDQVIAVPSSERTYANTVHPVDHIESLGDFAITYNVIYTLKMVSTDAGIRKAAEQAVVKIRQFAVGYLSNNVALYRAIKEYHEIGLDRKAISQEQQYFIEETIKGYKRSGIDLPEEQLQRVIALNKEIGEITTLFGKNISEDNRGVEVTREGLAGLSEDLIAGLQRTEGGNYLLKTDYPTYNAVRERCTVEDTRKRLYKLFNNRAYPVNEPILKQLIAKRDELAQLLGYESYADLNLDDSMVKAPARAQTFLDDLIARSAQKEKQEFADLLKNLPDSVTLTKDGKLKPWDVTFVQTAHKEKHFDLDERAIAEYFPMQKTIEGLLSIYRDFFDIDLKQVPVTGLWHPDVTLIQVQSKNSDAVLGYLMLDLHPRENKYSHACEMGIIPAVKNDNGPDVPAVASVICNFPKATADKPALLERNYVSTFFHEFGHALHHILGRTQVGSFSGTSVKIDFVELPSQMLEEWLLDKKILKEISGHYVTGEPLSDDVIDRIIAAKNHNSGFWVLRQGILSQLALDYYKAGADKDLYAINKKLLTTHMDSVAFDFDNHMYASFGHLTGYGAQYYGYMWSKVFALDLFYEIKKHGLRNPAIGTKYVQTVIGRGGSKDPNELLVDFLGREPNSDAFFADLGL